MKTFTICNLNRWTHLPGIIRGFIGAMLVTALIMPAVAISQYPNPAVVPLGTAGNFRILAGSAITINTGCTVTGNVGISPGSALVNNGTINGTQYLADGGGVASAAQGDLTTAYNDAAGRANDVSSAVELGGTTLGRGVYRGGTFEIHGILTLNGTASDVFIFQMATTLTSFVSSSVNLTGGAVWSNVFWQVGSSATIDGDFQGIILALTAITQNGGSETGRLLARNAAVTVSGTSVLPVEMVVFAATANRMNAELRWSTATEVNNYGFEIQRRNVESANIAQWQKVGFVAGAGTSNSQHEYSYADCGLSAGRYAYRVKQIDNDGLFKYSSAAEVEIGLVAKEFILNQNYPNPFNPSTMIEFTLAQNDKAVVKVFNILGQDVATLFDGIADAGKLYQVRFDASSMSSGMYYVRLESNGQSRMQKIVYMK